MNAHDLKTLSYLNAETESNDEFDIPLDIFDIINICKEYSSLGWQIQNQVEQILEVGVEESVKNGFVKKESLPHIKSFIQKFGENPYFGDIIPQSNIIIEDINMAMEKFKYNHALKN